MTVLAGPAAPGSEALIASTSDASTSEEWVDVCAFEALIPDRGVAALVGGRAVAVFRCAPRDELFAVAAVDPYSSASVLSRGIVGSVGDRPMVASPVHKQRFDLATGAAVDDPAVHIDTWSVRRHGGRVQVAAHPRSHTAI